MQRRLAAIVATDMVGYSRLIEADETGTIERQKAHREELIDPKISEYGGRIVKTTGDGLLIEFPSVVDAIRCAVEVQRAMAEREADVPADRRIQYRIGINLGDIIIDGDDILGDGVNIAARLEALAEPGGICVRRTVRNQVRDKLDLAFEDMGEIEVKNIARPVRVFRVLPEGQQAKALKGPIAKKWPLAAAAILLVGLAGGGAWWWRAQQPDFPPADPAKMAYPLPGKPSIAVLPFDNLSGDPEQDYIADGLSENIISSLSKVAEMLVIARNSSFTYKGKAVQVPRVAEALGVRYVLEGSVQQSGDQLRVTAQLIDAVEGYHIWSERYDRRMADLFPLQDDITQKIVVALQVNLTEGEQARIRHRTTNNLRAWGYAAKGYTLFERYTPKDNARARELFEQAVEIDPGYTWAWVWLGSTYFIDARLGFVADRAASIKRSSEIAQQALAMDDSLPDVHALLALNYWVRRQYDEALAAGKKAVALGPGSAENHAILALITHDLGDWDETIALSKTAVRLHPYFPSWYLLGLSRAYVFKGEYDLAVATAEEGLRRAESDGLKGAFHSGLAFADMEAGREDEARRHVAERLRLPPPASLAYARKIFFFKNPAHLERFVAVLRRAGIPENPPLPVPTKPSIAILPFDNLSGDPEQDYFADGMAEDIITDLSKISGLFVIARNSSFSYRGTTVEVRTIGRELGVRYILEGSVRRVGDRVRINAQLIDATTGGHLWAERYDGGLADVFALQDQVTAKIVAELAVTLTPAERQQAAREETRSVAAYDAFLKGWVRFQRRLPEDYGIAVGFFKQAVALDPAYGRAYAALAVIYAEAAQAGRTFALPDLANVWDRHSAARDRARAYLKSARENPTPLSHVAAALLEVRARRYDQAVAEAERALALDPNDADSHAAAALVLTKAGQPAEAVRLLETAMRLNPRYPAYYDYYHGLARFALGQTKAAVGLLNKALERSPTVETPLLPLMAAYAELGQIEAAEAALKRLQAFRGMDRAFDLSVRTYMNRWVFRDAKVVERFGRGLAKAGICCEADVAEFVDRLREAGQIE